MDKRSTLTVASGMENRLRIAQAHRDAAEKHYKSSDLISADEDFASAVDILELPLGRGGEPRSKSGEPLEEQMLAACLASRAQCILDMADGGGILRDSGRPFVEQFADHPEDFDHFRRQCLKEAEEVAEKACLVWADEKTLLRLGLARKRMAEMKGAGPESWLHKDETIFIMQDAGRCFIKSLRAHRTDAAEGALREVRAWLSERDVTSIFPAYV
mmetsp:Transcript_19554/g.49513  ORF Transcript_19554/g.49513 Transcript_19554/m.49513 type:complete len:215 (+) Transcript_19554:87-731(+)